MKEASQQLWIENLLTQIPEKFLPQESRRKIRRAAVEFNNLARFDERSGQVLIHEETLKKLLHGHDLFGDTLAERVLSEIEKTATADTLVSKEHGKRITWPEAMRHMQVGAPVEDVSLRSFGLDENSTEDDLLEAFRRRHPECPTIDKDLLRRRIEEILQGHATATPKSEQGYTAASGNIAVFLSCVESKIKRDWFVMLLGALVAFACALPNIVAGLILAAGWVGFVVLVDVLNCAIDPYA